MKIKSNLSRLGISTFVTIAGMGLVQADDPTIIELGTLGGFSAIGSGINDYAEVTGYSWTSEDTQHAFLYDGIMYDLGVLPDGTTSRGTGINDLGHVTGYAEVDETYRFIHAFIHDGSTMYDLGTLPNSTGSYAYAINSNDQVTGRGTFPHPTDPFIDLNHAFLYADGSMQDLGTLGGLDSQGYGINDNGYVVGKSSLPGDEVIHAFLYDGNSMQDLGTLGGTHSAANDINETGQITGLSHISGDTATHAFVHDGSNMQDLGTLGGSYSSGLAINDYGQVVGYSQLAGDDPEVAAFLFDGNSMLNLCTLTKCTEHGWDSLSSASGINEHGDITGYGYINGVRRAFLIIASDIEPPATEICDDGIDNDGDGRADCKDKDCRKDPVCKVNGSGKIK